MGDHNENYEAERNNLIRALAQSENGRIRLSGQIQMVDTYLLEHGIDAVKHDPNNPDYAWWVGWALKDRKRLEDLLRDNGINPENGSKL